jgi:flagellar biosynthesis/type III secretory pathway protein FliH
MHPLEEKDSSPLEDAEITRLINVSKELGYKKQDKIPERNLVDFKPTSIMQIARSSNQKDQTKHTSEATQSPEMKQTENESELKESPENKFSKDVDNQISNEFESNFYNDEDQNEIADSSESLSKVSSDIPDEPAQPDKINAEEPTENQESKVAVNEDSSVEMTAVERSNINSDESDAKNVEDAKREGIELGKKIALTDLENEQQRVIETFQLLIDNIKTKEAVDKTELTQSILKTITRLASERAGSVIEKTPEPFKDKIISFVEKIEQESKKLILNLNPRDASLIEKSLVKNLDHKDIEIRENSELFRGDFILQMGSVEIGDLISEQISISEENDEKTMESTKIPLDTNKETDKKIAPDPPIKTADSKNKNEQNGDGNGK